MTACLTRAVQMWRLSPISRADLLHMQATEYSKYGLLPKNFLKDEKWKERARNYMDVVEPLEKADYERSSFAAEYGAYHEKDNRPQQFAYIEKL